MTAVYATAPVADTIPRFPLAWPLGWPRTRSRRAASFNETVRTATEIGPPLKRMKAVSMAAAVDRLERQLRLLPGRDPTLSTNVRINLRGLPYGDDHPPDPGAAIYFTYKGRATVLACDRWTRVADNVAAIAAHLDAIRRVDRYGVGTIEQALEGYKALPADSAADWRRVLGFASGEFVTVEQMTTHYRAAASRVHPDHGGSEEAMMHINRARDFALDELTR